MIEEWEDVPETGEVWQDVEEPWNLASAAKQFGAGVVEGTAGLGALALDVIKPQRIVKPFWNVFRAPFESSEARMQRELAEAEAAKQPWVLREMPASVATAKALKPVLPADDPTYRYSRTVGQFAGPGAITKVPLKLGPALVKMAVSGAKQIPAALGAQVAEDVTGEEVVAPLGGAVTAGGLFSLVKGLFGAAKRGVIGATAQEVKGSAAKAFKDQTGLKSADITGQLTARADDPLLAYKTTAEVTDNAGAAQLEKTLAAADEPARLYSAAGRERENARNALVDRLAPAPSTTKEGLGTRLMEAATQRRQAMGETAQEAWRIVPRYEGVDIGAQMDGIARMMSTKQAGLPVDKRVQVLVDQFMEAPMQTSGALQDIRSSALELLRDANIRDSDARILRTLQANIDEAVHMGGSPELYASWRAARDATSAQKSTFGQATAGGALTRENARPSNVLANALKGDSQSIRELRAAVGDDPALMDQVSRGVLESVPRDSQGRLTAASTRKWLNANEGGLKELFGEAHFKRLNQVLADLQSEAKVGEMAFRASRGGSWTSQRGTVAGAVEDLMLSASTKGMPHWIGQILQQLKEGAGIRDKIAVRDMLFKAAMNPRYAAELAATPTRERILTFFERLKRITEESGVSALKSGLIEVGSSTALPKESKQAPSKAGSSKSETKGLEGLSKSESSKGPQAAGQESQKGSRGNKSRGLFTPTSADAQQYSLKDVALLENALFGGARNDTNFANIFGATGSKKNGDTVKYAELVDKLAPALVQQESAGNAKAVSRKGARGLMQIMPATWREWAPKVGVDLKAIHDPVANEKVGRAYLNWLLEQFGGDPALALAAYNHGIGNVQELMGRWGNSIADIYPALPNETQQYVLQILGPKKVA